MANKDKENKIKKFTKEAIGKTLNQFNKEIGIADLVEVNKNQDRILNGILSQVNDESTEKTEKSNIITLDNSTDGIVELQEIQGDTNVNVSKIAEETPITHVIEDKEGNVISLDDITEGAINIDNIQGNTMVNCNKEADKELILMEDLSTEGYSNITLNKGVDGGLVDVALEGNTMVNVCDQKDPVAITKSYTVETGNHVALQGEYDGKCRPVITGNTLVNLWQWDKLTKSNEHCTIDNEGYMSTSSSNFYVYAVYSDLNIEIGKTYTYILEVSEFSLLDSNGTTDASLLQLIFPYGWANTLEIKNTGYYKGVFTAQEIISTKNIRLLRYTGTTGDFKARLMLLEGDYTNKPIPGYFEGLQSSFEDKVVTQEMIDNGEELAENLGKYKVDYVISREDGTVGFTKTFYLNSPLLEGDTIEEINGGIYHVHRYTKVVLDGVNNSGMRNERDIEFNDDNTMIKVPYFREDITEVPISSEYDNSVCDKLCWKPDIPRKASDTPCYGRGNLYWRLMINIPLTTNSVEDINAYLQSNPLTFVLPLKAPTYELIEQSNLAISSYANGHLDLTSAVPVSKVNFLHFEEELTYLYPATSYTVQFMSDKAITVDINLGGTELLAQSIVTGLNRINITTPSELVNNKLVIDGLGAKISEVVVTDTDREFKYFEGMKSVGECEGNEIKIISNGVNILDKNLFERKVEDNGEVLYIIEGEIKGSFLERNIDYYFRRDNGANVRCLIYYYDENMKVVQSNYFYASNTNYKLTDRPLNAKYFKIVVRPFNTDPEYHTVADDYFNNNYDLRISTDTWHDYKPYQKPNTQQLTHEPLRGVRDIKDRYVMIDGKWYIERNCGTATVDNLIFGIGGTFSEHNTISFVAHLLRGSRKKDNGKIKCNAIKVSNYSNYHEYVDFDYISLWGDTTAFCVGQIRGLSTLDDVRQYFRDNNVVIIYTLATPTYEEIDYNPFDTYADVTHITNNSTIPCNMTIKNTGYNCLLKPSTTYTVSSNLGLNTVTTPSTLTEDCLRFYDTDTSDITTMKNVTILEGDYTTNGKPIPSHFSGIESAFEQEYDESVGKYKVKIRVQNEDASKENYIEFYIDEPLRGIRDVKDRVYVKNDKVVVERNCGSVTLDGSETIEKWATSKNCYFINVNKNMKYTQFDIFCLCDTLNAYNSINLYNGALGIGNDEKNIIININKDEVSIKQWLQQNPTTVVYQLAEPTYEEVEYSESRLFLNTYNNSTLFYESNIPVSNTSFKPLWEELVYLKNSTKYYIQFNSTASGTVVFNLGGTEVTKDIVEGYNNITITTPAKTTNLLTIDGHGIKISEVVVSESLCSGHYLGLQSCFEEHMENGKYVCTIRGIALDGSKVNGIKLYLDEPLRGVGDIKDRLCIKDGKLMVERKCASVTLDGSDDEGWVKESEGELSTFFKMPFRGSIDTYDNKVICDKLKGSMGNDALNDYPDIVTNRWGQINVRLAKQRLSTQTISEFKTWLQQNPLTVVYQLAEPVYEEATSEYGLPIVLEGYENGIVYIDSAVIPTTSIKYTSNNVLATTLSEAEEQNNSTQDDINVNVVTYMMDIDMLLTEMEMSNDISVMAVRRDNNSSSSSNENMLDRMSDEDKKVYRDNTVVMLEKMITANVLEKEDIERRINMYYDKNRISKEQYNYLKSLL